MFNGALKFRSMAFIISAHYVNQYIYILKNLFFNEYTCCTKESVQVKKEKVSLSRAYL